MIHLLRCKVFAGGSRSLRSEQLLAITATTSQISLLAIYTPTALRQVNGDKNVNSEGVIMCSVEVGYILDE